MFNMKKKLVIVSKEQFGYQIDSYKYCEQLNGEFDITYICFDRNLSKIVNDKINVIYIQFKRGLLYRFLYFVLKVNEILNATNYDVVFCIYFRFCFLLPLVKGNQKFLLDIRTGSVSPSRLKRFISNIELRVNALFFNNITVISEGVAKKLKLSRFEVLPLGADSNLEVNKQVINFNRVELLYVGTLTNRRIHETVIAYGNILNSKHLDILGDYTIIGYGNEEDVNKIKDEIIRYGLERKVHLIGRIPHDELPKFFKSNTVGVSYVPVTDYYTHQPPTKTYEYLMNGLACIATDTAENKKLINKNNGILCEDSINGFEKALEWMCENVNSFNRFKVANTIQEYSWEKIVHKRLKSILLKVIMEV